jgi:hypothetical protein
MMYGCKFGEESLPYQDGTELIVIIDLNVTGNLIWFLGV